jgi:hypothetical protein
VQPYVVAHLRSEPPPLVLSKHKQKAGKQPGWDFVPNADDWAELDAMNEEAELAAAAMSVGGCTSQIQLTHSLKAPGFNP